MRKKDKRERSAHGVIVKVYGESCTIGSRPRKTQTKHSNQTTRSRAGYDRRAELLAYAHQLRNVGPHHDHDTLIDSYPPKPKKRRRWLGRLKTLKFSLGRLFGGDKNRAWKYENIEATRVENKHRSCPSRCRGRNRWSTISKRLRRVFRQFSCGRKGFHHNDKVVHRAQSSLVKMKVNAGHNLDVHQT